MDITLFAETNFRNQRQKFGIKNGPDRRKHFYVIGKTGMGKTTLLRNMAIQDIQSGKGVGIVDPHGEFAGEMLNFVPQNRVNDVIYFNPADLDYPIAFNPMEKVDPEHRHLIASALVSIFKKNWAESWGPRLEYLLRNAILALLEYPGSTLLGIMRILVDKEYRKKVIARINDPVVKSFWTEEFTKYPDRFAAEAVAPIQNKVGQFLTSPLIRNIVGQVKSSIDVRKIMDEKKILIANLSTGAIGEDNSNLLGAMVITKIQQAAMSRIDIPEEERQDFYLYVDEFQKFATEAFANILSEARKYRLDLTLAHQYITQMDEKVRDAVFGNVGTLLCFRVGAQDAEFLEREFKPEFTVQDLVNLDLGQVYLRLMIDGIASRPFSASTLTPFPGPPESHREKIVNVSRERYAIKRRIIEDKIAKWSGLLPVAKPGEKLYDAVCSSCGARIKVNFNPDPTKPVYCKECLKEAQRERARLENAAKQKQVQQQIREQVRQQLQDRPAASQPSRQSSVRPAEPEKKRTEEKLKLVEARQDKISLSKLSQMEPTPFGRSRKPAAHKKERTPVDLKELDRAIQEAVEPENKE